MIKKLFISTLIAVSPLAALASTDITNIEFGNGDVTIDCKGGNTVQATFRIVVDSDEVVEYVQTDLISDSLGPVDHSVGGTLGLQEGTHNVKLPLKCAPNTGMYDVDVQTAGIFGGIRAINGNDNVNDSETFSDAVRVVSSSSSSSSSNNDDDEDAPPSWLSALLAQIQANMAALLAALKPVEPAPGTGGTAPICSQIKSFNHLSYGMNGAEGLQNFLIQNGYGNVITYGVTGFFGSQTQQASNMFRTANNCW